MQLAYEELYGVPGADIRPEFITPQDSSKLNINRKKAEPQPPANKKTNLNPNYTFDTFVVEKLINLPTPRRSLSRRRPAAPTTRCFCTAAWASGRRT